MANSQQLQNIIRKNIIAPYLCKHLSKKLIPILGCQRSGTTLTFLILTCHPKIKGLDESDYEFSFSNYPWRILFRNTIKGYYSCFKLPQKVHELSYIIDYYPYSKIIWPVRSCYATISSMKKLIMKKTTTNKNWLNSGVGSIRELKTLSTLFSEINDIDIEHLKKTMPVALGAYVWKYKMLALRKYQEQELNIYDFPFEELVDSPEKQLPQLLDFIGVPWDDRVLHPEQSQEKREKVIYAGGTRADRPIDRTRKSPKLSLTQDEIDSINAICGAEMASYGYSLI
ncbi:sulfotransferase family protein [Crocosphaera sp.]|uniref:sulfotransferase family protein n=1 Tax=Crocosphaera sp. TaxID=2729996 RepID=UPI003F29AF55|nr:sulfotransferase [Crocosphaera sp.]